MKGVPPRQRAVRDAAQYDILSSKWKSPFYCKKQEAMIEKARCPANASRVRHLLKNNRLQYGDQQPTNMEPLSLTVSGGLGQIIKIGFA